MSLARPNPCEQMSYLWLNLASIRNRRQSTLIDIPPSRRALARSMLRLRTRTAYIPFTSNLCTPGTVIVLDAIAHFKKSRKYSALR